MRVCAVLSELQARPAQLTFFGLLLLMLLDLFKILCLVGFVRCCASQVASLNESQNITK